MNFGCEESFVESFDFHYDHNSEKYGIDSAELDKAIQNGSIPVIIIRSFKTIREIKQSFDDVKVIFISGAAGEELRLKLIKQGRAEKQVAAALKGAEDILKDLQDNSDVVDEYLRNEYDEDQYLARFQSLVN